MTVTTKQQVISLLEQNQGELRRLGVSRCGLFGSFRTDILVVFQPGMKTFNNFMDLCFFLEDLFGRSVDLVTPESLSPFFGQRILDEVEYVPFS